MFPNASVYLAGTRHPWMSLLFVVPLLLAYEGGRWSGGPTAAAQVRNGAEHWLRQGVEFLGFQADVAAPGMPLALLLTWSFFRRHDRPRALVSLGIGMVVESALFAGVLYLLSQAILPVFEGLGVFLQTSAAASGTGVGGGLDPQLEQFLRCLGAGVYEESLFRLGLFTLLYWLFQFADFPPVVAINLAAVASALIFAGAHHVEAEFNAAIFLYRSLAGFYFAWIYQARGLGIAIGAHTLYNVLIGLLLPSV